MAAVATPRVPPARARKSGVPQVAEAGPGVPPRPATAGFAKRMVGSFVLAGAVVALLLAADSWSALENGERQLEARLAAEARNRAMALEIALRDLPARAAPVVDSDLIRLVADQLADPDRDASAPWLRSQVPFARAALADLVATRGLHGAALMDVHGGVLLAVGEPPPPPASEAWRRKPAIGPVRLDGAAESGGQASRPWMDVFLALSPPRVGASSRPAEPSAIFAFTIAAEPLLGRILTPSSVQPIAIWLAQTAVEGGQRVQLHPEPALLPPLVERARKPFWPLLDDEVGPVVESAPVDDTPFRMMAAAPADVLVAALRERLRQSGPLALALMLASALALAWRPARGSQTPVVIEPTRAPDDEGVGLDPATRRQAGSEGLLEAFPGASVVLDREGRITAANGAARAAVRADDVVGQRLAALGDVHLAVAWQDLLGNASDPGAASAVRHLDDGSTVIVTRSPCEEGTLFTCQTVPEGTTSGATRDPIDATVGALVRAIELRDPFLLGHTERLRHLAGEVGRRLHLDRTALATLDIAAALSQIGKTVVPDAVLTKPGRHDQAEERAMRTHVEHAATILAPLDFGLPVVDVLLQMHERLDGSGYPKGLAGERIDRLGRILGIVEVFCARTSARSYRDAVRPGQALYYLARHPERYDGQIVAALAAVVAEEDQSSWQDEAPGAAQGHEARAA